MKQIKQSIIFLLLIANMIYSRPMRVLFVVHKFPVLSETPMINQIKGMLDRDISVGIYAYKKGASKKVHADILQHKMLEITYDKKDKPNLSTYDVIYCQFGPMGLRLMREMEKQNIDKKLVVCFRGYDLSRYIRFKPQVYRKLFKHGDLFFPVCEYFAKKLRFLRAPENKIHVIHSAIDCDRFVFKNRKIDTENLQLVSVCRLVEKKGLEYSIRAMKELVRYYPNCKYTIVGSGPLKKKLEQLIEDLNLQHHVFLVGARTHQEVPEILDKSDIFILASTTSSSDGNQEGIPNALKEAMAMGLPVVSTFHAGIPELIENGKDGFLVPEKSSESIAQKIIYIVEHPDLLASIVQAAQKKVFEEYSIDSTVNKVIELFKSLF